MNGLIRCAHCGKLIARGSVEMAFVDGVFICADCLDEATFECEHCGERHLNANKRYVELDDGTQETWCVDCLDSDAFECEHCGAVHPLEEGRTVITTESGVTEVWCDSCVCDDAYTCEDCGDYVACDVSTWINDMHVVCPTCLDDGYDTCEHCGEWAPRDRMTEIRGGGYICERCYEEHYMYCAECGEVVPSDDYDYDAEMCYECLGDRDSSNERQHYPNAVRLNYHDYDRPSLRWFGECRPSWNGVMRGIGVEVECDAPQRGISLNMQGALNDVCALMGDRVFFEYDCSLTNAVGKGFEMITQPHTLEAFYEMPWRETFKAIMEHGWAAHDAGTCGLHVHFSRELFGADTETQDDNIAKLMQFFELYYDDIVKVSRRTVDETGNVYYARKHGSKSKSRLKDIAESKCCGHYSAVNVNNEHTVEIRIMRGTLNYSTFMACIDFLVTVVRNSCRIGWSDTTEASEWLMGLKPETIEYVRSKGARFEGAL